MNLPFAYLARGPRIALALYLAFTVVAVAGFGTFGLHPQLLAGFPELTSFYAVSFRFFGQAHVVVAGLALAYYLARQARAAWLPAAVLVYAASLASELAGTATGLPFGSYSYSGLLGWKWFDLVPALIPLSWFLMALPAYVLARHRFPYRALPRIVLGAALLTAWDLALDPAMSGLTSYWGWAEAGPYYGMPLINLGGWMVTGMALMALIRGASRPQWLDRLSVSWMTGYYGLTILMPLGMLVAGGLWTGVGVSLAAAVGLVAYALRRRDGPGDAHDDAGGDEASTPADPEAFVRRRAAAAAGTTAASVLPSAPFAFFARNSRSFSFAARWFDEDERRIVAGLYAFCRTTDDLVDRSSAPADVVHARLDAWREIVRDAYDEGASGIPWLDAVMTASAERGVPFRLAQELVEGVRMDTGLVRIRSWDELDLYMYRVASVVGIWMCHLFGVHDAESHRRAAALGKAMQLTNILRDVGEDLDEDRIYLPAEVLARYDVTEDRLRALRTADTVTPAYRAMMHEMIGRAEGLYEYAQPGFDALPPAFGRAAAVAATVYRGIHAAIRRNAYDNLNRRAATGFPRKMLLAGRALVRMRAGRMGRPEKAMAIRKSVPEAASVPVIAALVLTLAAAAPAQGASPHASIGPAGLGCPALSDVRADYIRAVDDEERIPATRVAIESCDGPVYRAYDGALVTLKAKHAFWPLHKLRYVRAGLEVLDAEVRAHPANVEIRYLRLLSCYFLPGILGREWSVEDDFDTLAVLLPGAEDSFPRALYVDMIRFVLSRGDPNAQRREALRAALETSVRPTAS